MHFDILNEDVLARRIAEYELVILPEQVDLKSVTIKAIRDYVTAGGRILATGSTVDSGLADVLGIKRASRYRAESGEFAQKRNSLTKHVVYDVEPSTATNLAVDAAVQTPATILLNNWQKGSAAYLNTDAFAFYEEFSPYNVYQRSKHRPEQAAAFLAILNTVIDRLLPDRLLRVTAPRWYDVGLRRSDEALLVQLLNRARAYHQANQPASQIIVNLRTAKRPADVVLQPGAEAVDWEWLQGRLVATLSSAQVPDHRILEVKPVD